MKHQQNTQRKLPIQNLQPVRIDSTTTEIVENPALCHSLPWISKKKEDTESEQFFLGISNGKFANESAARKSAFLDSLTSFARSRSVEIKTLITLIEKADKKESFNHQNEKTESHSHNSVSMKEDDSFISKAYVINFEADEWCVQHFKDRVRDEWKAYVLAKAPKDIGQWKTYVMANAPKDLKEEWLRKKLLIPEPKEPTPIVPNKLPHIHEYKDQPKETIPDMNIRRYLKSKQPEKSLKTYQLRSYENPQDNQFFQDKSPHAPDTSDEEVVTEFNIRELKQKKSKKTFNKFPLRPDDLYEDLSSGSFEN